jgi:tRNA 2-thiouridine synthesizing protein C
LNPLTATPDLALLITTPPYGDRDPRAQLDVALAAAALDRRLELFFLGDGLLQIVRERDPRSALLSPGYRGWAALPDLAETRWYAEREALGGFAERGVALLVPVEPLPAAELARRWRRAPHAMVL